MNGQEVISQAMQNLNERAGNWNNTVGLLRSSLNGVIARAQQNIVASVDEATSGITRQFVTQLGNELSDVTQAWVDEATGQLTVVPEGTKFFNREGSLMNCLVELKPSVRRIRFKSRDGVERNYSVGLPFVQFNLVFNRNGRILTLNSMRASCSKTSIKSLESQVYSLPLPNVGYRDGGIDKYRVCTGSMDISGPSNATLLERVESAISAFWQSVFNTDLTNGLVNFFVANLGMTMEQRGNYAGYHMMFLRWQEKTAENPLFILEPGINLGNPDLVSLLIEGELGTRQGKAAFKNRMRQTITQNLNTLSQRVVSELRNVNVVQDNVETVHREAINGEIRQALSDGFMSLNREMTAELANERGTFQQEVARTQASLQRRERTLATNQRTFQETKRLWESEKLRVQLELHKANEYLKARIAQLEGRTAQVPPAPVLGTILTETPRTPRTRRPSVTPEPVQAQTVQPQEAITVLEAATQTPRANRPGAQRTPGVSWNDVVASVRQQAQEPQHTPVPAPAPVPAPEPAPAPAPTRQQLERPWALDRAALQAAVQAWRDMGGRAGPAVPTPTPAPAPAAPAPAPAPRRRRSELADIGLDLIVDGIL